jgi:O-6-methylguanine DNA methyltransferase
MPKKPNNCGNFKFKVVEAVKAIPVGETRSYQEIAVAANNPKAARAVARIMAANFDTSIPCHRVIRKDGTLASYNRGGEEGKRAILEAESKFRKKNK